MRLIGLISTFSSMLSSTGNNATFETAYGRFYLAIPSHQGSFLYEERVSIEHASIRQRRSAASILINTLRPWQSHEHSISILDFRTSVSEYRPLNLIVGSGCSFQTI